MIVYKRINFLQQTCEPLMVRFPNQSLHSSILPHHADLSHLSLQLGSRHVVKVVLGAALPAPRVRLHNEVLHVQRSTGDPRRIRCLAYRGAELGRSVVSSRLLDKTQQNPTQEASVSGDLHHLITWFPIASAAIEAQGFTVFLKYSAS